MARKIFDIDIDELTICKSPANRKQFFIKKMEEPMKEFIESLKKFMADDEDKVDEALTEEEVEKIEKLGKEEVEELKGAVDELNGYNVRDIPDDALKAIRILAKQASLGHPSTKVEEIKFLDDLLDVEKAGARFSKATVDQLKKVRDMISKLIGDKENAVNKRHKDLPDDVKAELMELERLRTEDKERLEKQEEDKEKAAEKRIKKLEDKLEEQDEEIEVLKKKKGTKKSIAGQESDEITKGANDDDKDNWPSVYVPGLSE